MSSKNNALPEQDPYDVLGVEMGASDSAITKRYRKLALKLHPDKNKGKSQKEAERIAVEFHNVKEARAFLLEPEHREARDKYNAKRASQRRRQQADKERNQTMSDRRKRMREELQRNEEEAMDTKKSNKKQKGGSKKKYNDEFMQNLKTEGSRMRQQYAEQAAEQSAQTQQEKQQQARESRKQQERLLQNRQVRLKWSRKKMAVSPDEHTLATLLSRFGVVEEVELMGSKGNTALVTFKDPESCRPCVESYRTSEQMRATFVGPRKEDEETRMAAKEEQEAPTAADAKSNDHRVNETLDERKARQAAERERLAREIVDQEDVTSSASRCVTVQLPTTDSINGATPIHKLQQAETDILGSLVSNEVFARLKALHT